MDPDERKRPSRAPDLQGIFSSHWISDCGENSAGGFLQHPSHSQTSQCKCQTHRLDNASNFSCVGSSNSPLILFRASGLVPITTVIPSALLQNAAIPD
jgi:hypothetical protein